MKKWIIYTMLVVFAATTASAQWWKLGFGENETSPKQAVERPGPARPSMHRGQRPRLTEEQREKMKAQREAIEKLTEAARAETDPVKKEELISQLRARLTEGAVKMHEMHRKRLERAEIELAKMKERLIDAEENIDQKVEEHLQKLLAGKRPECPEGGPRHKGPKPRVE